MNEAFISTEFEILLGKLKIDCYTALPAVISGPVDQFQEESSLLVLISARRNNNIDLVLREAPKNTLPGSMENYFCKNPFSLMYTWQPVKVEICLLFSISRDET